MDNLLQENASYLLQEDEENILLETAQPVQFNNYEFAFSSSQNAGILSFSERTR